MLGDPEARTLLGCELLGDIEHGRTHWREPFGEVCIAVLVPSAGGRSNLCVAVQAPTMRLTPDKALQLLPALQRAAQALSEIDAQTPRQASDEAEASA